MEKYPIKVFVTLEQYTNLKQLSEKRGLSMSDIVRLALEKYLREASS